MLTSGKNLGSICSCILPAITCAPKLPHFPYANSQMSCRNWIQQIVMVATCMCLYTTGVALQKYFCERCSENMQQIYRRTSMPKSDFNVADQRYSNYTGRVCNIAGSVLKLQLIVGNLSIIFSANKLRTSAIVSFGDLRLTYLMILC